ncbi:hypothetical protein V1281_006765 [Nitrobacteraceae bacterium AZCC 2161]
MGLQLPPMKTMRFRAVSWTALRSLGNSPSVRLSAIFPFVGYWILFNDFASQYLSMSALDARQANPGFLHWFSSSRLYFLYLGLLSLGIGSFIYQARCPYIIKKHADWSDYVIGDGDAMSDSQILSLGKVLAVVESGSGPTPGRENVRVYFMQRWYSNQSNEHPLSRLIVGVFFYAGLTLIAIPSIVSALKIAALFFLAS